MRHRKSSGHLLRSIFDYDTMIRSMTTLVKSRRIFFISACWRYFNIVSHSFYNHQRPYERSILSSVIQEKQLDVVFISIHSIRACISMSIKRTSTLLIVLLPFYFPLRSHSISYLSESPSLSAFVQ